ncbi:hypothetical protein [Streptomyces sp. NPDC001091]
MGVPGRGAATEAWADAGARAVRGARSAPDEVSAALVAGVVR